MIERDAIRAVVGHKQAAFFFALALVALAAGAAGVLWIPDSTGWAMALSAAGWIAAISALLIWFGATVLYYRVVHEGGDATIGGTISQATARLPQLWLWLIATAGIMWVAARWHVAALALLIAVPWLGAVAASGLEGLRRPHLFRLAPALAILGAVGALLPLWLWNFHPELSGLSLQAFSMAVRGAFAFALAVLAWLNCASAIGRVHAGHS